MFDSPSRLNPNKVLLREREGAADQKKEEAYRRENYQIFRRNLEEAFTKYDKDGNRNLDRDEFFNFMREKCKLTGEPCDD
jgi:Ca2+-binding EF-hand superfamily protein